VNKVRILILGPDLNAVSGIATHLRQLMGCLDAEFKFFHFRVGREGRSESRFRFLFRLATSPILLAIRIVLNRPDIIHINASMDHKSFPRDALYLAVARTFRKQLIFQIHGGRPPQELYKNRFLTSHLVLRSLRTAHVVVLLGQSDLDTYSAFAPDLPITVIPNALHIEYARAVRCMHSEGPLKLVYVGRLIHQKGIAECITASRLLLDNGRDFTLTIAGSGPARVSLEQQVAEMQLTKHIEFTGAIHGPAKEALWEASDIFVFPSFHHEGLPYALLESMAAGTVPITTVAGAHSDVITNEVHGLLVPAKDPQALFQAICRLDDDRQLLRSMAEQAVARIHAHYSDRRLARQFSALYGALADGTPRASASLLGSPPGGTTQA